MYICISKIQASCIKINKFAIKKIIQIKSYYKNFHMEISLKNSNHA